MKLFLLFTAVVAYAAAAAAAVEVRVSREASADRITSLPGLDEMPSYAMYAGNLRVDEDKTHFYWLVEGQKKVNETLLLWLNGGPGCSGLYGLLRENGPFFIEEGGLVLNPASWNRFASVLYIEAPVGVGYSVSQRDAGQPNDEKFAANLLKSLDAFFELHPRFKEASFYLSGESYAGTYIPVTANEIVKRGGEMKKRTKGIILGNSCPKYSMFLQSMPEFGVKNEMFPEDVEYILKEFGSRCYENGNRFIDECVYMKETVKHVFKDCTRIQECTQPLYSSFESYLNQTGKQKRWRRELSSRDHTTEEPATEEPTTEEPADVSTNSTAGSESEESSNRASAYFLAMDEMIRQMNAQNKKGKLEEIRNISRVLNDYLNRADVREAIHAPDVEWLACSYEMSIPFGYKKSIVDCTEHVRNISRSGVPVLLYYGDEDPLCNHIAGQRFTEQLGFEQSTKERNWYMPARRELDAGGRVTFAKKRASPNGRTVEFGNTARYVTIAGAGHYAPRDMPFETAAVVRRFIKAVEEHRFGCGTRKTAIACD